MTAVERLKNEPGLNFIELVVSVAMLSAIVAGGCWAYSSVKDKAETSLMIQSLKQDAALLENEMFLNETFAITSSQSSNDGSVLLTLDNPDTPESENNSFTLTPRVQPGTFKYSVESNATDPEKYSILVKRFSHGGTGQLVHAARYDSRTGGVVVIDDLSTLDNSNPLADIAQIPASAVEESKNVVGYVLLGFGGLVTAGGATAGGVYLNRRKKASRLVRNHNVDQWQKLLEKHDVIRARWSEYELDISKMIDFPVMADVSDEFIARLHHALDRAHRLRPDSAKKAAVNPAVGSDFETAVTELATTFAAAEMRAKKISWSNFTETERKHLRKAKSLLALASDAGASPAERQTAYKQALRELDGLIVPPQPAILLLEGKMSLLIEGPKTAAPNVVDLLKPHEEVALHTVNR